MSDITRIVIFKKENGEEFTFEDKYVQLTSLENKMLIFKFEASQDILKEGAEFFSTFNTYEQIKVDIGGTGDTANSCSSRSRGRAKLLKLRFITKWSLFH